MIDRSSEVDGDYIKNVLEFVAGPQYKNLRCAITAGPFTAETPHALKLGKLEYINFIMGLSNL